MKKVTVRVPATTANLGPGFDAFGCALSMYTCVSFEPAEKLLITGCEPQYAGEDNLAYRAYCDALQAMNLPVDGVHIHIDAQIPIGRGLGSSAALLAAGALGANLLHGETLTTEQLLAVTTKIEGHPDNLAPALMGGLTASMMEGEPVAVNFPLHPDWIFVALIPDFPLSTAFARSVLPQQLPREDGVYNISHAALVLKALETGNEALLKLALQDKVHQPYRKSLITDYDAIAAEVEALGASMCISGAGPTLLCLTKNEEVVRALAEKLPAVTTKNWRVVPLKAVAQGAAACE